MKNFICILFLILTCSTRATVNPDGSLFREKKPKIEICRAPDFLHPDARELTRRYQRGDLLNIEYLEKFIWLEPTLESYAICVICTSKAQDISDWDSSLPLICPEQIFDNHIHLATYEI